MLCFIGMTVLSLPYAPLVSTLVGVTAVIPIFGAYIGAIVSAFLILMDNPLSAVIFLVFLVVLQQVEGNLIYPRVVGDSIGLSGLWVLLAVIVGGGFFGIPGIFVGIPVMSVIYDLVREDLARRRAAAKGLAGILHAAQRLPGDLCRPRRWPQGRGRSGPAWPRAIWM